MDWDEAEHDVRKLYDAWIDGWNSKDAGAMAEICDEYCTIIGFDGSMMRGRAEVHSTLESIFNNNPTGRYVRVVRAVGFPADGIAIIDSVVGMVLRGKSDINPSVNAVQSMVAVNREHGWRILHFQNTPAAYHGRPLESEKLTEELRKLIPDAWYFEKN